MTEQQFDERLEQIEAEYARNREGAEAARDQEVARLFIECGWTQDRIAKRIGQSQKWVSNRLLFGRFLGSSAFRTDSSKSKSPEKSLAEWTFRQAWLDIGKGHRKETEAERFERVADCLKRSGPSEPSRKYFNLVKKPGIKKAVAEILADGKRRTAAEIADIVSETIPATDAKQVSQALQDLQAKPPEGMAVDHRTSGRVHKYRMVDRKKLRTNLKHINPDSASGVAAEVTGLVKECIKLLRAPEVGRCTTLALSHLGTIERMLAQLLVAEEVV